MTEDVQNRMEWETSRVAAGPQLLELRPLSQVGKARVFIHGYASIDSPRRLEELVYQLLAAPGEGPAWLLYWASGHWQTPAALGGLRLLNQAVRMGRRLSPSGWAASVLEIGLLQVGHFNKYQARSETLGRGLQELFLTRLPELKSRPLDLIGHSLGARVIQSALVHDSWQDWQLQDVVFLGGAAEASTCDWNKCLRELQGKIHNTWSQSDLALAIHPGTHRQVGRHPIPQDDPRIVNHPCPGFRHTHYWPRLPELLAKIQSSS